MFRRLRFPRRAINNIRKVHASRSWNTLNKKVPHAKQSSLFGLLFGGAALCWLASAQESKEENTSTNEETSQNSNEGSESEGKQGEKKEELEHFSYVIIGGGTAAYAAFRELKENKATSVLMITDESHIPYPHPPLSKDLWYDGPIASYNIDGNETPAFTKDGDKVKVQFQPIEWYSDDEKDTQILLNTKVLGITTPNKTIYLSGDTAITYDKCLIATGSHPKKLSIPVPEDSSNITTFQKIGDYERLTAALKDPSINHITVIGAGTLGSELAWGLASKAKEHNKKVSQVMPESGVMAKYFPTYLSDYLTHKFKEQGVDVHNQVTPTSVVSNTEGSKLTIALDNGTQLNTDHIVVCIGSSPNSVIAHRSGFEVDPNNGGIVVNSQLQAHSDLWAAGDVASYYERYGKRTRLEHHWNASEMGEFVAKRMLGNGRDLFQTSPLYFGKFGEDEYIAVGEIDPKLDNVGVWLKGPAPLHLTPKEVDQLEKEGNPVVVSDEYQQKKAYMNGIVYNHKDSKLAGVILWNMPHKLSDAFGALRLQDRIYDSESDFVRIIPFENEEKKVPQVEEDKKE